MTLAGIRVSDGHLALSRRIPAPDHEQAYDQQRGALALAGGRIYVIFGGHFGDCGPYLGSIVAVPAAGNGPILSYVVPTRAQAGMWAPGGPVVSPDGTIYVASGNGAARRPVRRQRLGHRAHAAAAPDRRLRAGRLGRGAPPTWTSARCRPRC